MEQKLWVYVMYNLMKGKPLEIKTNQTESSRKIICLPLVERRNILTIK